MKLVRLALSLAVLTAVATAEDFNRTLHVSGQPNVTINTGSGYIHAVPGSDDQVHVVGHVRANHGSWMAGDVDARVRQIVANPPISQSGSNITIGQTHEDLFRNITIDYDVTLPRSTTLRAGSGSGNLQIRDMAGSVTANTGSGDVQVENIGPNARLESGSGSIRANGVHGGSYLQTGSGDIELHQSATGDVNARTGSGSIRIHDLNGALHASTGSGDLEIYGQPTGDWRLDTGSGSVRLNLGNAKFNLDASTGSGSVHVNQPITMQGNLNRHHVLGAVNGGGPVIRAQTGSGDIEIR